MACEIRVGPNLGSRVHPTKRSITAPTARSRLEISEYLAKKRHGTVAGLELDLVNFRTYETCDSFILGHISRQNTERGYRSKARDFICRPQQDYLRRLLRRVGPPEEADKGVMPGVMQMAGSAAPCRKEKSLRHSALT